jgi:fucose 4-O-acetylase-like acetyltransferase
LAKGICISLVVLLHVFGDLSGGIIQLMNLFRMPLYFVLSGLFFKTYDGLIPFIKKKTNKLLIPFFFTFFFAIIPTTFLLGKFEGKTISLYELLWIGEGKLNLGIDGAIWFLLCLFAVNIYFYLIFLLTKKNVVGILILSLACGGLGYFMSRYGTHVPMWMDSALTAMPFFLTGYLLRCYSQVLYGFLSKKDISLAMVSLLLLVSVFLYDEWQGKNVIAFGENTFDIPFLSLYIGGIAGTYFVLMVAKCFRHIPIISYIGRYSIVVLLTHLLYLFVIRNILYQLNIPQNGIILNLIVFIIIMLLSVPTISFCVKYLPYWFAQKDLWK